MEGVVGTGVPAGPAAAGPAAAGPARPEEETGAGWAVVNEEHNTPIQLGQLGITAPLVDKSKSKKTLERQLQLKIKGLQSDPDIETFAKNLFLDKKKFTKGMFTNGFTKKMLLDQITDFLKLIRDLEPLTTAFENHSYILKYITVSDDGEYYGLDVESRYHLDNAKKILEEVFGLYSDLDMSPEELIENAKKLVNENFSILNGLIATALKIKHAGTSFFNESRNKLTKLNKNIQDYVNESLTNHIKDIRSKDPKKASAAAKFIVTNSLKITGSIYTVLGIVEYGASAAAVAASAAASAVPGLLSAAAAITTHGISAYMYLLNVLVFAPRVSAYSVLYVIFLLHKFNLWSGIGDMVMAKLKEQVTLRAGETLDLWNRIIEKLINPGVEHAKEFYTFLQENVYTPLGKVTETSVEQCLQLRVEGLNLKLDDFHGLTKDAKDELTAMLTTPVTEEMTPLIEIDPEYIPELTIPDIIPVYNPEPRALKEFGTNPTKYIKVGTLIGTGPVGAERGPAGRYTGEGYTGPTERVRPTVRRESRSRSPSNRSRSRTPPPRPRSDDRLTSGKKRGSKKGKKPKTNGRKGKSRKK